MKTFLTTLCIMLFLRTMKTLLSNKHYLYLSIFLPKGNTSLYSNITELSKSYNLPDFVPSNLDKIYDKK